MSTHWENYPHEADIGIRGVGNTMAEAFEQAAIALSAIVVDPGQIKHRISIPIKCQDTDQELLFFDWINAIIYEMAVGKMLFSRFQVSINDNQLLATISGESVDVKRHQPAVEIKGATFTTLKVAQNDHGEWVAQTVVDV